MTARYINMFWKFEIGRFGQDVSARRIEAKMTQVEVGTLAGVSGSLISSLERGQNENIMLENLISICNTLDLDPRDYWVIARLNE